MAIEFKNYTTKDIVHYIIANYNTSCLAYNINNYETKSWDIDDYDVLLQDCIDFFYYEKLNWCGCGNPNLAMSEIKDYLQLLYDFHTDKRPFNKSYEDDKNRFYKRYNVESVYGNPLLLCLAYSLDGVGFTEHGCGIGGAWPTEEGAMFLTVLNIKPNDRSNGCEKTDGL